MHRLIQRFPLLVVFALFYSCSHVPAVEAGSDTSSSGAPSLKTIQNPGGGTIVFGPIPGQQTYQTLLSVMLKRVEADYGDRPQLGNMLQSRNGSFWEGFFTFADKKQSGDTPMTGMVIVYAPQSGTAGGATLIDATANFMKSADSMLQNLVQTIQKGAQTAQNAPPGASATSASNSPVAPAQALTPFSFPDNSGRIGLPQGWTVQRAQQGDVSAQGPNGELLRFGLRIPAVNAAPGRGVAGMYAAIPYSADSATLFTQLLTQIAQKQGAPAPKIDIANTQNRGPQDFFIYADVDSGQGGRSLVAHVVKSPLLANQFQITISDIVGPPQVMQQEAATVAAIFSSYGLNTQQMLAINGAQIQQGLAAEQTTVGAVQRSMQTSDQLTQGMSDMLRGQSVFVDNETGQHYRGPDDLASALSNANPNRFQTLSLGQYIQGVDY